MIVFEASIQADRLTWQETKGVRLHPPHAVLLHNEPVFDLLIDVMYLPSSWSPQILSNPSSNHNSIFLFLFLIINT